MRCLENSFLRERDLVMSLFNPLIFYFNVF